MALHKHQHNHDHDNGHSHAGRGHGHHHHGIHLPHTVLSLALIIIFTFAIIEAIGGWLSGSLALLGDAGHMISDVLALGIAGFAAWVALKPPSKKHSYGYGRAEIIAAWVSSLIMLIISIAVIVEAVTRINHPVRVYGATVMFVASLGLLSTGFVAWLLTRSERTLNIRAALVHIMGDVLGSIAALVAGAVILKTGWYPIDPILSIVIGVLILISSLEVFRESLLILMEGVPRHISLEKVTSKMIRLTGIKDVHDLHIWTLSSGRVALSAHVHIHELNHWPEVLTKLKEMLKKDYKIEHITLQPEPEIIDCQPCKEPEGF